MRPTTAALAAALTLACTSLQAQTPAPSPNAAGYLAANCANCHGTDGRSNAAMPSLAGLDRNYFIEQMRQFREGRRQATIMHQLARGYTDEQIVAMANYFATIKR